jgi:broad specificity phosphatase PhoE
MRHFLISALLIVATGLPVEAQERVFVIRHAEKEAGDDPGLTPAGVHRAQRWAEMLRDAGLDAVIHTDAARTRLTGTIIAEALALEPVEVGRTDVVGLVDLLAFDFEDADVLVVAHSETIPAIVERLGGGPGAKVAPDDFASLFVLGPASAGARDVMRLHMP